jgi:hypothetical protein
MRGNSGIEPNPNIAGAAVNAFQKLEQQWLE